MTMNEISWFKQLHKAQKRLKSPMGQICLVMDNLIGNLKERLTYGNLLDHG